MKHTLRHPSGRLSYRRVFPIELRPFLPGREHKVSLGQSSDAGLLIRWDAADRDYDRLVAKARRQLADDYDELGTLQIERIAETFYVEALAELAPTAKSRG